MVARFLFMCFRVVRLSVLRLVSARREYKTLALLADDSAKLTAVKTNFKSSGTAS